ncbi:hypothetical protein D3C80_237150 [compost metagenome]
MSLCGNEAPEFVGIALAEEAEPLHLVGIVGVDAPQVLHVQRHLLAVDEWPDERPVMKQMHRLRRRIDVIHVARVEIIRRKKLGDDDRQIAEQQEYA